MEHSDLEKELEFEQTLAESEQLLNEAARGDLADAEVSLESILAEFKNKPAGESAPLEAPEPVELSEGAEPEEENAPQERRKKRSSLFRRRNGAENEPEEREDVAEAEDGEPSAAPPEESSARREFNLDEVMAETVSSVLEENKGEEEMVLLEPKKRRGLFSRRPLQDTEQLPQPEDAAPESEIDEDFDDLSGEEEAPFSDSAREYRALAKEQSKEALASGIVTLLMWVPLLLSQFSLMPEIYEQEKLLNCLPFFIAELLVCILARDVFIYGFEELRSKNVTFELLASVSALLSLADTALSFFLPARTLIPGVVPLHAIASLGLSAALYGRSLLFSSLARTFRVASVGDASYLVTITSGGAAKRRGETRGFSRCAQREDLASHWQSLLLPVIFVAALVFALLATIHTGAYPLFLWNWSVILTAVNTLSFPLVYALPFFKLSRRFLKSGAALGGYAGADRLRRSNCMILTDTDLFPPGTVTLNGLKIYGEESGKVFSYAATMAHAAGCGCAPVFDSLLESEHAALQPVDDLNFYEEGGVSATIHGESVLFGTASFMRRMGVSLPGGHNLKTGAFLSVDKTLVAIFAVKYMAAENVDWALHSLRRNRITPVLAVRDSNITPQLLKRKFGTDAKAVYPKIATRLALSEKEGVKPCALLFREGLMPYAEVTIGSKRLIHSVRLGNRLSLFSAVLSALLAFYLTYAAAYTTLTPPAMALYLILWALTAVVDSFFVDRY